MADLTTDSLLPHFELTRLLNTDQQGRRIILLGHISSQPALLLAERSAFTTTDPTYLSAFSRLLSNIQNLGENDIYRWYLANSITSTSTDNPPPPDLKLNLIYPCTEKHIRKYSYQKLRIVLETPQIYKTYIRPYMQLCREQGRLTWVFNILSGKSEQENILFRSSDPNPQNNFIFLPDLNWDRKTIGALHLLAVVERRDIWSVRDLKKRDVGWLRELKSTLVTTTTKLYPDVEEDMLKVYVHYQPTYYHFHVHVVHVDLDAGGTQAVGKALGLDGVIGLLENLGHGDGGEGEEEPGMHQVELSYTLGESSELWQQIYLPLKEGREPEIKP